MFCIKCGKSLPDGAAFCPSCGAVAAEQPVNAHPPKPGKGNFPGWKLFSGIASILIFVYMLYQSALAAVFELIGSIFEAEVSATDAAAGFIVAALVLAGGIVSIAVRYDGKLENAVLLLLYAPAAMLGFANVSYYEDLYVWSSWCVICAIMALIALITSKPSYDKTAKTSAAPTTSAPVSNTPAIESQPEPAVETPIVPAADKETVYEDEPQPESPRRRGFFLGLLLGIVLLVVLILLTFIFVDSILPIITG